MTSKAHYVILKLLYYLHIDISQNDESLRMFYSLQTYEQELELFDVTVMDKYVPNKAEVVQCETDKA
jgi:hypothetical protein